VKISFVAGLAAAAEDVQKRASAPAPPAEILSPAQFAGSGYSYGSGQTVQTDWDEQRAIQEGYRSSTWPFACMDRLQGAASSVPWVVYERRGRRRREWERQDGHPYELAIEYPMPGLISRQTMVSGMVLSICCGGNALARVIYVTRGKEQIPVELNPMSTALWRPVPVGDYEKPRFREDREGFLKQIQWVEGYRRLDRPRDEILEPWKVIHAQKLDPGSWIWGMSPMRPIAPIIDMDRAMVAWNARMPTQFMIPAGAFVDKNLRTDGQLREAAQNLRARYQDPARQGVPLFMGAGQEWIKMGQTMVEADWDASRKTNRDEVCAAFNISPTLFVSDSKYANMEQGRAHLLENGARDLLELLQDAFNTTLVPDSRRREAYIAYDLADVPGVKDTLPQRLESHAKAVGAGIPVNSSIYIHGLDVPPVEGGDTPLVSGLLVPLPQLVAKPEEGEEPEEEEEEPEPQETAQAE
jgi:phage portal protein BeeE